MKFLVNHCYEIIPNKVLDSPDGSLTILEALKEISFNIKRVYYINNLIQANSIRGKHAHKELEQALFCISGHFTMKLDDGENSQIIKVSNNSRGLFIGPLLWHEMTDFSSNCVILVLASDYYNESDYLRSYDKFLNYIKDQRAE